MRRKPRWVFGIAVLLGLTFSAALGGAPRVPCVALDSSCELFAVTAIGPADVPGFGEHSPAEGELVFAVCRTADSAVLTTGTLARPAGVAAPADCAVAFSPVGGEFVIVWAEAPPAPESPAVPMDIYFQRFTISGESLGQGAKFNTAASRGPLVSPRVAYFPQGAFVVFAAESGAGNQGWVGRRFVPRGSDLVSIDPGELPLVCFGSL